MLFDASDEVQQFLESNRGHYRRLLDAIVGELEDVRDRPRGRELVYRIYTRADKQAGGNPLKSEGGIAKKLARWRNEDGKLYRVSDVHDIIGVTVVTYFDSGVDEVVERLNRAEAFRSFDCINTDKVTRGGYSAVHVTARGKGVGRQYLLCEIQVKALLNDSWATKMHDLTYKATTHVDPHIKAIIEEIGNMLQRVEAQSQQLHDIINLYQKAEKERRFLAIRGLFGSAVKAMAEIGIGVMAELAADLLSEHSHYSTCDQADPRLVEFVRKWAVVRQQPDYAKDANKLLMMLAVSREDRELDQMALGSVSDWVASLPADKVGAGLLHKAEAHWSLGFLDKAIEMAQAGLEMTAPQRTRASACGDLAYYMAERLYLDPNRSTAAEELKKINSLLSRLPQTVDERRKMSLCDTRGAIRIMTATSLHDVTKGLRLCEQAWSWAQTNADYMELFYLYFSLHEERARRKITMLTR